MSADDSPDLFRQRGRVIRVAGNRTTGRPWAKIVVELESRRVIELPCDFAAALDLLDDQGGADALPQIEIVIREVHP